MLKGKTSQKISSVENLTKALEELTKTMKTLKNAVVDAMPSFSTVWERTPQCFMCGDTYDVTNYCRDSGDHFTSCKKHVLDGMLNVPGTRVFHAQYESRLKGVANQALKNAVETANLAGKARLTKNEEGVGSI
jgi:hypothetical protein